MHPPLPDEDLDAVLDQTQALWRELSGERIFITGGTGFFGAWLLETFVRANRRLQLGAHAVVLSRRPEAFLAKLPHLSVAPEIHMQRGDATDFEFPAGRFACVIHAATEASDTGRDVLSTRRTLDFAVASSASRHLFTSSGAVYGPQPHDVSQWSEDFLNGSQPPATTSPYGQAKLASESLCALYAARHGLSATVARCFAFVGPHLPLDAHFAVGNFLRDALRGGPIRIEGDGTPYRSYLYASDLVVWLWTILFRGVASRPYNVGSDQAVTIAELAHTVSRLVAPAALIHTARPPVVGAHALRYVPSIDRARDELGLGVRVDLDAAIVRTAAWLR